MTALTFILGVTPLAFARGAGAVSQQAIGTAVMGGMLTATVLGLLLVPVFYVAVCRAMERWQRGRRAQDGAAPDVAPAPDPPRGGAAARANPSVPRRGGSAD